ncbi:zinc finger protein 629-like [Macrobrachium nipponense]|uniref:zinc finger protein 629-like n=1 Tax=Macrobrachium nipponense TaxID=159736 RepID=UPI0030C8BC6E
MRYNKLLYKCPKCLKSFIKKRILDYHVKYCWLEDENNYECLLCGSMCNSYMDFVTHMKVHENELMHRCPFCGQYFLSLMALKKHERWHKERQLSSLTSADQFSREADSQNHVQAPSKEFYCPYCRKIFGSRSFVVHNEHNSEVLGRTFQCRLCGLYFLHRCEFMEHNREHKRFDKKLRNLVRRKLQKWVVLMPSGEYIYCGLCGKSYKILDEVISHLESHFKEFVDHKRLQKSASYSLPLNNKSWETAALLQCIDEISPRKLPKDIFLADSNNVKQNYKPLSNTEKERDFDDQLTVCQSDNNFYLEKDCQSSRGSVTYGTDVFDVVSNIKPKLSFEEPGKDVYNCSSPSESQVTKHFGNDGFSGTDQLIDSLMKNSKEIPATQKILDYEIGNSLTVDTNTCESNSKESALLKNDKKEVCLKGNETTANIVSVTSTIKDMDVVGKAYADLNQAKSERTSEHLCQSGDDSLKSKSEFLKCPACHLSFERQAFVSHIILHEKESWFICHDCGLSFWCRENLRNHRLSNHLEAGSHSAKTVKVASYEEEMEYVVKLKKKNEVNINPDGKKYNCNSCGFDCSRWGDFLNHIFQEKESELCCLEQNISNLNENQKSILKRTHEEHVHNEEMLISKWRKYFGIKREVKVFLERMVPCKTCEEYYGTTEEDRQKHQMGHKKS